MPDPLASRTMKQAPLSSMVQGVGNFGSGMARLQAGAQSKATAIASILPATFWLACSSKRTR
jgi:hypothetical protein